MPPTTALASHKSLDDMAVLYTVHIRNHLELVARREFGAEFGI
jgi:hypothetical protein